MSLHAFGLTLITEVHCSAHTWEEIVNPWEIILTARTRAAASESVVGPCSFCLPRSLLLCVCVQPTPMTKQANAAEMYAHHQLQPPPLPDH